MTQDVSFLRKCLHCLAKGTPLEHCWGSNTPGRGGRQGLQRWVGGNRGTGKGCSVDGQMYKRSDEAELVTGWVAAAGASLGAKRWKRRSAMVGG
jgi:hypothetical protein